eukprot:TRINITY_DN67785_c0_g1_i1.p1 TRINITY_DN67785_c0_g1~~TRINITY_DN67785_c0_g1_i1.p1  ORF type:complete len:1184 (+),score=134.58 TRINITY_DN67785_c0_g1_i1:125-3676(+)
MVTLLSLPLWLFSLLSGGVYGTYSGGSIGGLRDFECAGKMQLLATYDLLQEALEHFSGLYAVYTRDQPGIVAEYVKAVQLHAIAQDFVRVVEAFRLLTCLALCEQACSDVAEVTDALTRVNLVERINDLQLDVELVASEAFDFLPKAQSVLREAKQYAAMISATVAHGGVDTVEWEEALTICVAQVTSRVLFPLLKIVSLTGKQNDSHTILSSVSLTLDDPASFSASYLSPVPFVHFDNVTTPTIDDVAELVSNRPAEFSFTMLESLATRGQSLRLSHGPQGPSESICKAGSPYFAGKATSWPRRWRLPPRSENDPNVPKLIQMLEQIESRVLSLSYEFIALRPAGGRGFLERTSCDGVGLDFDPTQCLESRGWGGTVWAINIHPPYRAELHSFGRSLGDSTQTKEASHMDIWSSLGVPEYRLDHLFARVDHTLRQTTEPSPDIFFLHPAVHNCFMVEYLFSGQSIKPKILVIPINPLVPPPFEIMPRFEVWWRRLRDGPFKSFPAARAWVRHADEESERFAMDSEIDSDDPITRNSMDAYMLPHFWIGQCSIAAVSTVLRELFKKGFKYDLHHVDGPFAIYVRQDLNALLADDHPTERSDAAMSAWLRGWFCRPESRYFSKLEVLVGPELARLSDPSVSKPDKEAVLCRMFEQRGLPIQKRNFDCAHIAAVEKISAVAGKSSCLRQDQRGWGNDELVSDGFETSAADCEARCRAQNCSFWTFDPTNSYGMALCWIWVGGRPTEITFQKGWISGDADCHLVLTSSLGAASRSTSTITGASSSGSRTYASNADGDGIASSVNTSEAEGAIEAGSVPAADSSPITRVNEGGLSRKWAMQQTRELPGARYFLESRSRGRCVEGFCECFPPYRGPLCEQIDSGNHDSNRNFSGVLHYLTSDEEQDIVDIEHSLKRLWRQYNGRFDYPVVIFHDGLSVSHRERIVEASYNRIWFAYVDDYLAVPEWITEVPDQKSKLAEVKWSIGYRGMCRFRSGTIFLQPVLRNFQYAMTLDTDGYFPAEIIEDPIAAMHVGGYTYTYSHILPDSPGAVRHFWDYSLMYMRMMNIDPRGTPILRQFVGEDDVQWNYNLYMNDIEIVRLDWFRSDPYQDYFRYLDSVGGFWLHRWGDHAMRSIAVGMWLPEERVYKMDIPYGHQNYCSCSDAHPDLECLREGDVGGIPPKWFICAKIN